MNNALRARRWSLANLKIIAPAFILSGLVNRRNEFCWNFSGRVSFNSEYMKRLKDGDPETKRHFIAYFGGLLLIKLRGRLGCAPAVEGLRRQTLRRVLTALPMKQNLSSPESLGIFVNSVCVEVLRERNSSASRTPPTVVDDSELLDEQMIAESTRITEQCRQQVRRVLEELHEKDRELLRRILNSDGDKAEICQSFGVNQEYLRVLLHRAKVRYRERLLEA